MRVVYIVTTEVFRGLSLGGEEMTLVTVPGTKPWLPGLASH